jgi:hypothetical protein
MKILFLSNKDNQDLSKYLKVIDDHNSSDLVDVIFDKINKNNFLKKKYDLILKDRYYLELKNFLFQTHTRIINFHPSYLPENMKSDSNLWSIINNTKKGSSIIEMKDNQWRKYIIICQKEIFLDGKDTLKSSYQKCIDQFKYLFKNNWKIIRENLYEKKTFGIKDGKIYYGEEKGDFINSLKNKYDTPVQQIPKFWKKYLNSY